MSGTDETGSLLVFVRSSTEASDSWHKLSPGDPPFELPESAYLSVHVRLEGSGAATVDSTAFSACGKVVAENSFERGFVWTPFEGRGGDIA